MLNSKNNSLNNLFNNTKSEDLIESINHLVDLDFTSSLEVALIGRNFYLMGILEENNITYWIVGGTSNEKVRNIRAHNKALRGE